jgi:hypothetical protein
MIGPGGDDTYAVDNADDAVIARKARTQPY